MKIPFSHMLELVGADAQVILDVAVEWEDGNPKLYVHGVLDTTGKVSLFRDPTDRLWCEIAAAIVDEAEKCPRLLARAITQWDDEREAA